LWEIEDPLQRALHLVHVPVRVGAAGAASGEQVRRAFLEAQDDSQASREVFDALVGDRGDEVGLAAVGGEPNQLRAHQGPDLGGGYLARKDHIPQAAAEIPHW